MRKGDSGTDEEPVEHADARASSAVAQSRLDSVRTTSPGGLEALLRHPGLWRSGDRQTPRTAQGGAIASGWAALDASLPGGGWPCGALTEILTDAEGIGELSLVLPALARLGAGGRRLVMIASPYLPYAPALAARGIDLERLVVVRGGEPADHAWAAELALGSGDCAAVLAWLAEPEGRVLRRLQLAAERGDTWGVVYRPASMARRPSPAALRLRLGSSPQGVSVEVLKCRGGRPPPRAVRLDDVRSVALAARAETAS